MKIEHNYKPLKYYLITFITTYALWAAGASASHTERGSMYMILMLIGLLMPFIISLIMTFRGGKAMTMDLLNRLINIRLVNVRILPVFFLIMPFSVIISIFISIPMGGSPNQLMPAEGFSFSTGVVPVLTVLLIAAAFEELGWRGYAFDSLLSRFNYFKSSLIFSILWSLWHLPLILVKDSYQYEIMQENAFFAINFFVSIIPMGFIISWICIKNRKSIFAAVLFHFIVNMSQEILNITQETKCIQTVVLTIFTIMIIMYDKKLFFSNEKINNKSETPGFNNITA